jgi:uncharacterized protein (DUF58 family)
VKAQLARINHILVPSSKRQRDRYRHGWLGRRLARLAWVFARLSREGRALASMASLTLLFGADIARGESHVLSLATLSLVVAALLFSRGYRSSGLVSRLHLPQRVAVGEEIEIAIELVNEGRRDLYHLRTEPPLLPWDGTFSQLPADIERLARKSRLRTSARARFVARGAHHLDPFRVAALVPLALAQGAAQETPGASFLVVPKVARVVRVSTPRGRRHQPGGVAGASRTGDATDLAGVRPYRPGDPLRDLHARSWARLGTPMVRQYQEEYFTRIGVVVDTATPGGRPEPLEAGLSLCAGIIARLCRGEALVDVLVTGEHAERLSLGRSLASLERALDVLSAVKPFAGFAEHRLLGQLGPYLGQLSSVVLVALDWDEARARFVAAVEAHSVSVVAFAVGDAGDASSRVRRVPIEAIASGQELAL